VPTILDGHYPRAALRALSLGSRSRLGGLGRRLTLAGYAGILQADAYDGYNKLYLADRKPAPIREAACWVHARRPFFAMADIEENDNGFQLVPTSLSHKQANAEYAKLQ
jgi:hypothetical protein